MRPSCILLLDLSAGALAYPSGNADTSSPEKRIGHAGWVAPYAPEDTGCHGNYLKGNDGLTRPSLRYNSWNGDSNPVNFTVLSGNIGIYCGSKLKPLLLCGSLLNTN